MAYDNSQNEPVLPNKNLNNSRKSINHLPKIFRTPSNNKFLAATLDQMIQPGVIDKINGFVGRKTAKAYNAADTYISDVSTQRQNYQLEPASVIKDDLGNVTLYRDYNDYMNVLANSNKAVKNDSVVNEQEFYAWNPHIDWDKFTNFREYYWLPTGPQAISIFGNSKEVESTYTVRLSDNLDSYSYIFTPDGSTPNPTLTLYRGIKYKFDVDVPNFPITFRTKLTDSSEFDLDSSTILLYEGVDIQGLETGNVTLELSTSAPDSLWYVSATDINVHGKIIVKDIQDSAFIDVEKEIIGKKTYKSGNGVTLSNGMKINFAADVEPEFYKNKNFYVEGVGDRIQLVEEGILNVPTSFTQEIVDNFDVQNFDNLPYSTALGYAAQKDYIVINRSAKDGNLWSKYNKWFHKSVIEESARYNNLPIVIDETAKANRPIIEFESGIKLYNFGSQEKQTVDLLDDITTDVFSTIEGSIGYNIDGVDIADGQRILFTNDKDSLVKNRIFKVKFITYDGTIADDANVSGRRQITLQEEDDSVSKNNETVLVKQGNKHGGTVFHFKNDSWELGQRKDKVNQSPLFDMFDENDYSFSDVNIYPSNTFTGTKIFSYKIGTGTNDAELGFPLTYRNINNVGDIVFTSDISNDTFSYSDNQDVLTLSISNGYLHRYTALDAYVHETNWKKVESSEQFVIQQKVFDSTFVNILIDEYDNSWDFVDEMKIIVYKNNKLLIKDVDFTLSQHSTNRIQLNFTSALQENDIILTKTKSRAEKNSKGYYEFPYALERNPQNENLLDCTLGEINDHVQTITENTEDFIGTFPGTNNLRDLSGLSQNGRRFLQHSAPINLSLFHFTEKEYSVVKSIEYAKNEYYMFKKQFLSIAENLGFSGPVDIHVNKILQEINKSKKETDSFYFSDMVPQSAFTKTDHDVEDSDEIYFPLSASFSLTDPSYKAVLVYKNNEQLIHGKDYTFNTEGYAIVTADKQPLDIITIYEYENTFGNYIPPTPTKLGLYPAFEPMMYEDTTFLEPQTVIQGHDGSITIAYGDYRDNLILELEKRIFNNIKVKYDPTLFNLDSVRPSYYNKNSLAFDEVNKSLLADFVHWAANTSYDYTTQEFIRDNRFTYNYRSSFNDQNVSLPGFWREIYKYYYNTDRPHTHPWEVLGETIEPIWWRDTYGEAPYTKDNFLMWEDIENGILRQPNQRLVFKKDCIRKGLSKILPVDEHGALISPLEIGLVSKYNSEFIEQPWIFGDGGPVEAAWRRSSNFIFALLKALVLNKPSTAFGTGFDRVNQVRNKAGNIIYKPSKKRIELKDIIFPLSVDENQTQYTSGLVNLIAEFVKSNVDQSYDDYKNKVKSIKNQLGFKLAGFTDKTKLKLILDSRTPLNKGNVFVPDENYQIFVNESSPIELLNYSGIIVERRQEGFLVKGYSNQKGYFNTHPILQKSKTIDINVGGISESFLEWSSNNFYTKGVIVRYNSTYYRCIVDHREEDFLDTNFVKLPNLPVIGGRNVQIPTVFNTNKVVEVPYGTLYYTIQEVVDFIASHGSYLKNKGFVFDYFDDSIGKILDWNHSIQEFVFWTLYELNEGSAIALSPSSNLLQFVSKNSVVSSVTDGPNDYTLLNATGNIQEFDDVFVQRYNNDFSMYLSDENGAGIYHVELPMTQTEHVVLLDNSTVFNDIIYDTVPGYRQERLQILGYRTDNWSGNINIPGFIYNDSTAKNWEEYQNYVVGDLVKYKQYYYIAKDNVEGSNLFDEADWVSIGDKPRQGLLPNFEYKSNQFTDFYDLDSDNLDTEQQKFAQHLIGYQKRDYLENIINNSVSQYKFYQGMILEKGTKNSLNKLFNVLSSNDKDSLEFYEEWAIRNGQYGGTSIVDEFEFNLDESQFTVNPQPILLTSADSTNDSEVVYRVKPFDISVKPANYNNLPFPSKEITNVYTNDVGYVHKADVSKTLSNLDDLVATKTSEINQGNFVWVGNYNDSWNVLQHINANLTLQKISNNTLIFSEIVSNISEGDIIGIDNVYFTSVNENVVLADSTKYLESNTVLSNFVYFFKVSNIDKNKITLEVPAALKDSFTNVDYDVDNATITRFEPFRFTTVDSANNSLQKYYDPATKLWIDNIVDNKWKVLENTNSYSLVENLKGPTDHEYSKSFGSVISSNTANNVMVVGDYLNENGKVFVYRRQNSKKGWYLSQTIEPSAYADPNQEFGKTLSVSDDAKWLLVGSPAASNVKSNYKGDFSVDTAYNKDDIVFYSERLWKAKFDLLSSSAGVNFNTFDSVVQNVFDLNEENTQSDKNDIIYVGNYSIPFGTTVTPFEQPVDHILVRAPAALYNNTLSDTENWQVKLQWNLLTLGNQDQNTLVEVQPFSNQYASSISNTTLTGILDIESSIDIVLFFETLPVVPSIGETIQTSTGTGVVDYVYSNEDAKYVMYIKNVTGSFNTTDSAFRASGEFIGDFEKQLDTDGVVYGGFWKISTSSYTPTYASGLSDSGRGLVFVDMSKTNDFTNVYHNIFDTNTTIIDSENNKNSYIRPLSNIGFPNVNGVNGEILSTRYVIRAPKSLTDTLSNDDTINLFVNELPNYTNGVENPLSSIGLSPDAVNGLITVDDLWDGYIQLSFTKFQTNGTPYEPKIGQTIRDMRTGATARVEYYQRDNLDATLFVSNVTGNWSKGEDYNDLSEIEFLGNPSDPLGVYQIDREMGDIQFISLGSSTIGKLIVVDTQSDIELVESPSSFSRLENAEYSFYTSREVGGEPISLSAPSILNANWTQTFSIPADENGTASNYDNQGMYSLYYLNGSLYAEYGSYVTSDSTNNYYLGSDVKIRQQGDNYKGYVHAAGNNTTVLPGKLHFINKGTYQNIQYDWEYSKNKKYKGPFDETLTYEKDDIVVVTSTARDQLYKAKINIAGGTPFDVNSWELQEDYVDYVGYIPNTTNISVINDSTEYSGSLESDNMIAFAKEFDISKDGNVIVVKVNYNNESKILVYRNVQENYQLGQTIVVGDESSVTKEWVVSISNDGMYIAVGKSLEDTYQYDEGQVFIYQQKNGIFELVQVLENANKSNSEMFGYVVNFDDNKLVVSARNASAEVPTSFDAGLTSFDAGFTNFNYTNEFQGIVYIYEKIQDRFLLGQKLFVKDPDVRQFGKHLHLKNNNIYVGLPIKPENSTTTNIGEIYNFKLTNVNEPIWVEKRSIQSAVDLEKIKEVYLYNTKTGKKLVNLDYIDINQGKIAGIVDQEISYKTFDDPAVYSSSLENVTIDKNNPWGNANVGKVWWDLTNANFFNAYQKDIIYSAQTWNMPFVENSIDVYEWVESIFTPEKYNQLSLAQNADTVRYDISGEAKTSYNTLKVYDYVSKTFSTKYYFWVKNKTSIPASSERQFTVKTISEYILNPVSSGVEFISLLSSDRFVLNNVGKYLAGTDVALNVQYYKQDSKISNIHTQYEILSENLDTSQPSSDIIEKWFDSLVGYDNNLLPVPDDNLPVKYKYGNLSTPRQSWFVNRFEANKQLIERVNAVLKDNIIVEDKNLTPLLESDRIEDVNINSYDLIVDDLIDLEEIQTEKLKPAILQPTVVNGKITDVTIVDYGRGYKKVPEVQIYGKGENASIELKIDSLGRVVSANVINEGKNFTDSTILKVRSFSVLVKNDTTLNSKWAIYERNNSSNSWVRTAKQKFDTTLYWDYVNWYESGYNNNSKIDHIVSISADLYNTKIDIGQTVKIANIGSGGWLLLKRINNTNSLDYTVDYQTIGRENGTIQLSDRLYLPPSFGYDSNSFDVKFYDFLPVYELRNILNAIRNNLFVDDLLIEFNKLFFASIRYVLSEQTNVDWVFKTSFVKAKHNVGSLRKDITFNNDNLADYEQYLKEVKPFKTKIREYSSSYENLEPTNSFVTDFDLTQVYDETQGKLIHPSNKIKNNQVDILQDLIESYPNKHWYDNIGYSVVKINITDNGSKYRTPPKVKVIGGGGTGAEVKSYIGSNGKLIKCEVINEGFGYTSTPTLEISHNLEDGGKPAILSVELGNGLHRSVLTGLKFDRTAARFTVTEINAEENFVASGSNYEYNLKWPMVLSNDKVEVYASNRKLLRSEYQYSNVVDKTKTFARSLGKIITTEALPKNTQIKIIYKKSLELLNAADRINAYYTPTTGSLGKDLAQLMTGVDYGGVAVRGTGFEQVQGWDNDPWYTSEWDAYVNTNDDEVFEFDQSTVEIQLSKPLAEGTVYNVYLNNVRLDDPNYDGSTIVDNPNAIMQSLVGDGVTQTMYLDDFKLSTYQDDGNNTGVAIVHGAGDKLTIRKSTSDGTYNLNPNTIDTELSGGNLNYGNARGVLSEDILVDGDGFVTPVTSSSVEEHVPGQVLDSLNIKVYERPSGTNSNISTNIYYGNGVETNFNISSNIFDVTQVIVSVDNVLQKYDVDYTINVETNQIVFSIAPNDRAVIRINNFGLSADNIVAKSKHVSDGSSISIITGVSYKTTLQSIVIKDGKNLNHTLTNDNGIVVIVLGDALENGDTLEYVIFDSTIDDSLSTVVTEEIPTDGNATSFTVANLPMQQVPYEWNTVVICNDRLLDPGYVQKFEIKLGQVDYVLDNSQIDLGNIASYKLHVEIDNVPLIANQDYTWNSVNGTITISNLFSLDDKKIMDVYIRHDVDYAFGTFDSNNIFIPTQDTIHFTNVYNTLDDLKVITFANHDNRAIEWQRIKVKNRDETIINNDYIKLSNIQRGKIYLNKSAYDAQYVWVSKNGNLLVPNADYYLNETKEIVNLTVDVSLDDEFIVVFYAANPLQHSFAWQQFKDILNKTHYQSLDGSRTFALKNDLNWYDREIILDDASLLTEPNVGGNPGVVWIDKERIEYHVKHGNKLSQLRRGTLGTGIKDVYTEGTLGIETANENNIPYKDEFYSTVFTADGTSSEYLLDFANAELNEFEVFVAGKRLRKNSVQAFRFEYTNENNQFVDSLAADSPEGDITLPPEFTISNDSTATSTLILNEAPKENTTILVIRKKGMTWSDIGMSLVESNTDIAKFLRATTVDLPR